MALIEFIDKAGNCKFLVTSREESSLAALGGFQEFRIVPLEVGESYEVFKNYDKVITVEDGCLMGGFGSAILEFMADHQYTAQVQRLGIPDAIIEHGSQLELQAECGFDPKGIEQSVIKMLEPTFANK